MLVTRRLRVSTVSARACRKYGAVIDTCIPSWTATDPLTYRRKSSSHAPLSTPRACTPSPFGRRSINRCVISLRSLSTFTESHAREEDVLPVSCPGCGALSQESDANEPGYFSRDRKAVKAYFKKRHLADSGIGTIDTASLLEEETISSPDGSEGISTDAAEQNQDAGTSSLTTSDPVRNPFCDRCHDLIYNSKGHSIAHPSVEDIADSIAESPYKRNHVYHVLDAADFPMSLFPKVFETLELAKPRSQNRRARHKFTTRPSISFIITRSDLLAPAKEMVDKMLPYFQSVLRTALGRVGRHMRMGNVHLVSAKRGWWTTDIKENIWERGGGNWMVGRVNVGKSNLFEVLFPKGSGDRAPIYAELEESRTKEEHQSPLHENGSASDSREYDLLPENSLLPPPQPELRFPTMPIVSSLPGTTASPIRLPFGGHRGELIDLPGLERGSLEEFVQPEHKLDLVMQYRPRVQQHVIKPGQSLLLGGGLIRITPQLDENDSSTTMLAFPFVPVEAHVTSTDKAIAAQNQERESGIKSILADGASSYMSSAGMFRLNTDVTKLHAGPLVRAGVPVSKLAFTVYSTDILIEGLGWVELVCQTRKPRKLKSGTMHNHQESPSFQPPTAGVEEVIENDPESNFSPFAKSIDTEQSAALANEFSVPQVEIFSPNGKHIGYRPPLGAWLVWNQGRRRGNSISTSKRARKPMAGSKRREKQAIRAKANVTDVVA